MQSRLFAVVSWGCAATAWLAKALNAHADVFCSHLGASHWRTHARTPDVSGVDLISVLDAIGEDCYLAAGDVRGMNHDHVAAVRARFGERFKAAVVVREPLARVRNTIVLFEQTNYQGWSGLEDIDGVVAEIGIDPSSLTVAQRHFVHAVNMLNSIIAEKSVGRIYRSEDLTSDPAYLIDLLIEITRDDMPFVPAWALAAVTEKKVDAHRETLPLWTAPEKKIFRSVVRPEAWAEYRKLGYPDPALD